MRDNNTPRPQWKLDAEADAEALKTFAGGFGVDYAAGDVLLGYLHRSAKFGASVPVFVAESLFPEKTAPAAARIAAHAAFLACPALKED